MTTGPAVDALAPRLLVHLAFVDAQPPADHPLRQEIEADTNRRSAPPYEALTPDERLRLLAGLAALP